MAEHCRQKPENVYHACPAMLDGVSCMFFGGEKSEFREYKFPNELAFYGKDFGEITIPAEIIDSRLLPEEKTKILIKLKNGDLVQITPWNIIITQKQNEEEKTQVIRLEKGKSIRIDTNYQWSVLESDTSVVQQELATLEAECVQKKSLTWPKTQKESTNLQTPQHTEIPHELRDFPKAKRFFRESYLVEKEALSKHFNADHIRLIIKTFQTRLKGHFRADQLGRELDYLRKNGADLPGEFGVLISGIESRWQLDAKSRSGARGAFQLMPELTGPFGDPKTFDEITRRVPFLNKFRGRFEDIKNPNSSIKNEFSTEISKLTLWDQSVLAGNYLETMATRIKENFSGFSKEQSLFFAVMAYNAGPNKILSAIKIFENTFHRLPKTPLEFFETSHYGNETPKDNSKKEISDQFGLIHEQRAYFIRFLAARTALQENPDMKDLLAKLPYTYEILPIDKAKTS